MLTVIREMAEEAELPEVRALPVAEALHYAAFGGRIVLAGVKGFKAVPDFVSDLIVVKEDEAHLRGRDPGEVPRLIHAALRRAGLPEATFVRRYRQSFAS